MRTLRRNKEFSTTNLKTSRKEVFTFYHKLKKSRKEEFLCQTKNLRKQLQFQLWTAMILLMKGAFLTRTGNRQRAKLPCKWCEDEVPEDELYHGVCLTCIENYYDPELARQFIEDAGIEAYFYVGEYMHTDWNTIDIRVIDACKKEFWEKLSIAKFNAVNFPALYTYDEKSVWELQCLKEYVLSDDIFYDWADWVINYEETREKVAAAAKAGKVVMIATQPAKQEVC